MNKRIITCFVQLMTLITLVALLSSCSVLSNPVKADKENESESETNDYLFDENGVVNFETIDYSRDIEPLNRTFKALENTVADGFWKYYEWGSTSLGPSNYKVCGFIIVSPDEIDLIEKQFSLEKIADIEKEYLDEGIEMNLLQFPKGISPEITGYSEFDWGYSAEFEKWLEAGRWIGDAFYDMNNKIIYVYFGVK